jgi:hypothetical protein
MKLIVCWTYLFITLSAFSGEIKEISDEQIKNTFISQLKDTQIENQLSETAQFKNCVKENQFDPKDDQTKRNEKLKKATECFKKELAGSDATALEKLSDNLQLQSYGLVKSKNVNDITDYFSKKLSKALTGRDPDDKNPDRLLWENQKIVDQDVYIDLYKAQLAKAAIFEISRFCFEHLRKSGSSSIKNFEEHWKKDSSTNISSMFPTKADPSDTQKTIPNIDLLNDNGDPSFFDMGNVPTNDLGKQEVVYQKLKTGLTSNSKINLEVYKTFLSYCMQSIPLLCNHFKQNVQNKTKVNGEENSVALEGINSTTKQYSGSLSKGSSACLTMDHLSSIRTTLWETLKPL